jgi:presenilin-like A22 family membrane protease
MESQITTGRRIVLAVIVATLTLSVLSIFTYNVRLGQERITQQIIRYLLTIGLCVLLYKGANWARWVMGSLLGYTGVLAMFGGIAFSFNPRFSLLLIVMGMVYLAAAAALFFIPAVRAYFSQKKIKITTQPVDDNQQSSTTDATP